MTTLRDQLTETIHRARMHRPGDPCAGGPFERDAEIADAVLPIIRTATVAALRDMADLIDRGPAIPLPPSVISALVRERADDLAADPTA